ncbi:MAG TPA: hypothetical protein VLE54_00005 [Thermoanaerobaculia bacterium]|nr:hypothetical protein [Thermoanaerobaculia bacterium]
MDKSRRSGGVRLATLLAACLTSASAFGLHPEPSAVRAAPASVVIALPGSHATEAAPHDCLACRAHRPLVVASNPAEVPRVCKDLRRIPPARLSPAISFEPASFDGRAPPSFS